MSSTDAFIMCSSHDKLLQYFCKTCKKSKCNECDQFVGCQNKHNTIRIRDAIDAFENQATHVKSVATEVEKKLGIRFHSISQESYDFKFHLKLCKAAIEVQAKMILKKVQEKSDGLLTDLENLSTENDKCIDSQFKEIESKRTQVRTVMTSIDKLMNNPEETDTLTSHSIAIDNLQADVDRTFYKANVPNFIPSTNLNDLIDGAGIGEVITVNAMYNVAQGDESITVTKEQPFVVTVKVSSLAKKDEDELAATLLNKEGEESAVDVEYRGGEYRITSRCNEEGDWRMKIKVGGVHVKGSPIDVKVEPLGLAYTTGNISEYKDHSKSNLVTGVALDKDGCILVSSRSKDILRFNPSGSFVDRIQVPQDVQVDRMHQIGNGHMVYSDYLRKCVVMCDDTFKKTSIIGKGILEYPLGLTVDKVTRVLYVADGDAHCVFKFNIDDGKLLDKIGSEGSKEGKIKAPHDVTLTNEGNVIVADTKNGRMQMFDANGTLRIFVGSGKVWGPCGVTMDMDENIIVSSNLKLQLFDKNGVFIKRIDDKVDGLDVPCGICVISNRPRRVAVANNKANNVKIFNY